jgi:hypothetical protein
MDAYLKHVKRIKMLLQISNQKVKKQEEEKKEESRLTYATKYRKHLLCAPGA